MPLPARAFMWGKVVGPRDVRDGASNTIAVGEWRTGDFDGSRVTVPQDVVVVSGLYPSGAAQSDRSEDEHARGGPRLSGLAQCSAASASVANNRSWVGESWSFGFFGEGLGNTLLPPNPPSPNCEISTSGQTDFDAPGLYGMSSYHYDGANVAMCDGSIRFLRSSMSMQTLWKLGSRDQGEILSAEEF